MKKILLMRHGQTKTNQERRYTWDMQEPLSARGAVEAGALNDRDIFNDIQQVYSTHAVRCIQTAQIVFPNKKISLCDMQEIDFGIFKGKNAQDLQDDKQYRSWVDSGCMADIPKGDSVEQFKQRTCNQFMQLANKFTSECTALVIHGGNIMALMEEYALPKKDFYSYHVKNCGYYLCNWDGLNLHPLEEGGL